jgi:hypothetical protein
MALRNHRFIHPLYLSEILYVDFIGLCIRIDVAQTIRHLPGLKCLAVHEHHGTCPFWESSSAKDRPMPGAKPVIITITASLSLYRLEGELRHLASLCLLHVLPLSNLLRSKVVGL